jgi:hypothetical protein
MESLWLKIQQKSDSAATLTLWKGAFEERAEPKRTGDFSLSALTERAADGSPAWGAILEKVRNSPAGELGDFDAAGDQLREILASCPVWDEWLALANGDSRTYLEIVDHRDAGFRLSDLPWEYLAHIRGNGITERYFTHPGRRLIRAHAARALPSPPLRHAKVLIVCGEAIGWAQLQFPADDVIAVLRELQSCSLCAHVELIVTPTLEELSAALERIQPEVIHFSGHGEVSPRTTYPALKLNAPNGPWWWDTDRIYAFFDGKPWRPRLVVLNTCEGAVQQGKFVSVMSAFTMVGVPAVIGAQARLRQAAAPLISSALYSSLAAREPIDVAMVKVRASLGDQNNGTDWKRREWGLPVLTLAMAPEKLFARPQVPTGQRDPEQIVKSCLVLKKFLETGSPTSYFVGLSWTKERWQSLSSLSKGHCIVIRGVSGGGKSRLVERALLDAVFLGQRVRYVEVCGKESSANFIDLLNAIIDGDPAKVAEGSEVHKGLDPQWFTEYQPYRKLTPDEAARENIERICNAFAAGLKKAAAEQELTIVLDHFSRQAFGRFSAAEFNTNLLPYLWKGIAEGQIPGLRVIFVVGNEEADNQYKEYQLSSLDSACLVEVHEFRQADISMLFSEFCRFQHKVRGVDAPRLENAFRIIVGDKDPWKPARLAKLTRFIEEMD